MALLMVKGLSRCGIIVCLFETTTFHVVFDFNTFTGQFQKKIQWKWLHKPKYFECNYALFEK